MGLAAGKAGRAGGEVGLVSGTATRGARLRRWTRRLRGEPAATLARQLTPVDRERLQTQLDLSAQKRDSAVILAASEQDAEALVLAEQAWELLSQAAQWPQIVAAAAAAPLATPDPDPAGSAPPRTLAQLGASPPELELLGRAQQAAGQQRPAHNRAVTRAHQSRLDDALRATQIARRLLGRLLQSPRVIVVRGGLRLGATAALVLLASGWFIHSCLDRGLLGVTATMSYDLSEHAPAMAVDRNLATEWLLPNRTLGTLEIRLAPRPLRLVRLRNARNGVYNDRGTQDFHVECYSAGKQVCRLAGSFPLFETTPGWNRLPLDVGRVDTLKIVVDSYHKSGGGLAEVSWD